MSLVLQSSGGGQVTIQEPATASNFTQTLPAATGTVMVSGNMPAFSAYQSSAQTALANATFTKVQFQTEDYDTNSNFDSTTNYRFTPTVAGYYQFNSGVAFSPVLAAGGAILSIYKNGSEFKRGIVSATVTGIGSGSAVCSQMYMNGSTDYVEIYGYQNCGSTATIFTGTLYTWFNGSLVRAE
jgi:hypothetical protein